MVGTIISAIAAGFLFGSLARLAVPGPDPMPLSLTVLIGLAGSGAGAAIAAAIWGSSHVFDTSGRAFVTLMLEVGVAIGLVAGYRRFVQKRPLWGPGAYRFPERGLGIARMRSRLRRLGIDRERHARGEISDEEFEQARERLRRY
jgi:uncharacterized membrane protein YeaQ/YmgE (transglycosylase-associated protein family)